MAWMNLKTRLSRFAFRYTYTDGEPEAFNFICSSPFKAHHYPSYIVELLNHETNFQSSTSQFGKAFTSTWRYCFYPRAELVVLIHLFLSLLLHRSTLPMQATSPEHLTGCEGPTGANGIQKGTRSLSAASASSPPWIFHSAVESAVLLFARMKGGRRDEGSVWVGVGWGGVRRQCGEKRCRPRFKRSSHREYALSHLVPQQDPGVYSCRPALQSFLEVV